MTNRDTALRLDSQEEAACHESLPRGRQMSTSAVAIRKLKLVLGHIHKMTCQSALEVGFLAMLMAFELAAFNDGRGLRASEHSIPALASSNVAPTVSDFQIKEWPRNLRTIRPGNDTSAVLSSYLREFTTGTSQADVYAIDIVWPGILSDYAEDLRPVFGDLRDMLPGLVRNDTVKGKLVAVPYFVEISLLYYRRDLLETYHFAQPPRSWNELERQARVIMEGERANGRNTFWGFLWQGAASEALTCNALEWQISQGGGWLLKPDGTVSLERAPMVQALERARRWIGTVSPPGVTDQLEDDSLRIWKNGDAAFMRNWPYAFVESMRPDSSVRNKVGVTLLPRGDGPGGRHADILGGFQLMVSKKSTNKDAAIELVKFLTSPEIQRVNAKTRGYAPTRPTLYDSPELKANPFFATLRDALLDGAVTRPSTAAGSQYDRVSTAYFTAVRQTLIGQRSAVFAVTELEKELQRLTSK
jgi:trehalose/maltose transport system substrate-binding protein